MTATQPVRLIQAVDRSLRLLEVIADASSPPSAPELARAAGVNRSTAWRLLATLEAHDLVERDPASGGYTVGFGALRIAAGASYAALVRRARPALERLVGGRGRERRPGRGARRPRADPGGGRGAAGALGALGRAEPAAVGHLAGQALAGLAAARGGRAAWWPPSRPPGCRSTRRCCWPLVDEAAATGVGTSPEDYEAGVTGFSVAVHTGGERPTAFVGVTGPALRLPMKRLPELTPLMLAAAAEVAAA